MPDVTCFVRTRLKFVMNAVVIGSIVRFKCRLCATVCNEPTRNTICDATVRNILCLVRQIYFPESSSRLWIRSLTTKNVADDPITLEMANESFVEYGKRCRIGFCRKCEVENPVELHQQSNIMNKFYCTQNNQPHRTKM